MSDGVKERSAREEDPGAVRIVKGWGEGSEGSVTRVRESSFGMTWYFVETDARGGGHWKCPTDIEMLG